MFWGSFYQRGRASAGCEGAEPAEAPRTALPAAAVQPLLFLCGAVGYGLLELLWRGRTHWSMLLCGGAALLMLYRLSRSTRPFWVQCAAGALAITGLELAVGLLVNRWLGLGVWDYSDLWGNLWGQICPAFSVGWLVLSALALTVLRRLPL